MTPNKAAKRAANCLMPAFHDTFLDGTRTLPLGTGNTTRAPSDRMYNQSEVSQIAVDKAMRWISEVAGSYPLDSLRERIRQTVVDVCDEGIIDADACSAIQAKTLHVLNEIMNKHPWTVLVAVRGIGVSSDPIAIGPVRIERMGDKLLRKWGQRLATGKLNPPETAPVFRDHIGQLQTLHDQAVATIRVRASDDRHAASEANIRVQESLDLMCYGQLTFPQKGQPAPSLGPGPRLSELVYPNHHMTLREDQPQMQQSFSIASASGAINDHCRMAPCWDELEKLLFIDVSSRSELQLRVFRAMRWIGLAANSDSFAVTVVSVVTGLESLLLRPHETFGKRKHLMNRIPQFAQTPNTRRHFGSKEVDELYTLRCECVHGGRLNVTEQRKNLAIFTMCQCFNGLLSDTRFTSCETLDDVVAITG